MMKELEVDERLTDGLPAILSQFPPLVTGMIVLEKSKEARLLRLAIFQAVSKLHNSELTVDQITGAQLAELLGLTEDLNPPSFQPAQLTPGNIAQQKAGSYVASYLAAQFVDRLGKVGNPPQMIAELTVDGSDYLLAQVQRLQFNFNQNFRIADYLADLKARAGLLAKISAKQGAVLAKQGPEVISLAGQVGQSLGTAAAIIDELREVDQNQEWFDSAVTAGQYPLPLLFAIEQNSQWFKQFFGQHHRPSRQQFAHAYDLSRSQLPAAFAIVNDLLSQIELDIKVLPSGASQQALVKLIEYLKTKEENVCD